MVPMSTNNSLILLNICVKGTFYFYEYGLFGFICWWFKYSGITVFCTENCLTCQRAMINVLAQHCNLYALTYIFISNSASDKSTGSVYICIHSLPGVRNVSWKVCLKLQFIDPHFSEVLIYLVQVHSFGRLIIPWRNACATKTSVRYKCIFLN